MVTMPKRRKSKDNPYVIKYNEAKNTYLILFKSNLNKLIAVEVEQKIYEAFNSFELEDIRQMHEYERHIEHSEVYENNLNAKARFKEELLEDYIIKKDIYNKVRNSLGSLSKIQKRRLKKYYFEDKNEYIIAKEENTTQQAINKSLIAAKKKLKEILEKDIK